MSNASRLKIVVVILFDDLLTPGYQSFEVGSLLFGHMQELSMNESNSDDSSTPMIIIIFALCSVFYDSVSLFVSWWF